MPKKRTRSVLFILVLTLQLYSCLHLKYSSPHEALEYSVLAKCEDIEGYLDLFKDIDIGGLYTDEELGYKIISPEGEVSFLPETYLDFIHLSDVQLCEERAYLFGSLEMEIFDALVDSLRHGRDQEKYDYAVLKSILLGIEDYAKANPGDRPSFLMHTGDSVHLSLVSELWEFLYLFDQSLETIPWFNAIGNHDVTVLGTPISKNKVWLKNPTLSFLPISSNTKGQVCDPTNFINFHKAGSFLFSGVPVRGPIKSDRSLAVFTQDTFDPNTTKYQGFDMLPQRMRTPNSGFEKFEDSLSYSGGKTNEAFTGYYAFDCRLRENQSAVAGIKMVRVIVLNTSEAVSANASGGISESQVNWVRKILDGLPFGDTRVIAFGHHPLIAGEGNMRTDREYKGLLQRLQKLFETHVDVYFCGHTHGQSFDNSLGFLQIMGPSLLDFPQSGHKVRIEYSREHMRIQVVPFSHLGMQNEEVLHGDFGQIVAIGEEDAEVVEATESIVAFWKEESYLKSKDINEIVSLWETDNRVKGLLNEKIKSFGKEREIKRAMSKAVLLKHAYLGRQSALEESEETDYSWLGANYRFIVPLKRTE